MPSYRFEATDSDQKLRTGQIDAQDANEATRVLRERGLRVSKIVISKQVAAPPKPNPIQTPIAAVQRPLHPAPQPVMNRVQTATPQQQLNLRPKASDIQRHFLFAQMAANLRSGINPAKMLQDIAEARPNSPFYQALMDASSATAEGKPMSEAFARYPRLFPAHVVSGTRAGELAGFLPDALDAISQQAANAHKFRRFFWWVSVLVFNAAFSIPLAWAFTRAILKMQKNMEEDGGEGDGFSHLGHAIVQIMLSRVGLISILFVLIAICLWKLYWSEPFRKNRHHLAAVWPVFGKRTRVECLTIFSWNLSRLTRGGVAPNVAWEVAAGSAPNETIRQKLLATGREMNEGTRLSHAAMNNELLSEEFAPMVATGEVAGDLPGILDRLTEANRAEFQNAQAYSRLRGGCWGALLLFVTFGIVTAILWYWWYHELIDQVLKGMDA